MRAETGKESHVGSALEAVVGGGGGLEGAGGTGLLLLQSSCCHHKGLQPSAPDRQGGRTAWGFTLSPFKTKNHCTGQSRLPSQATYGQMLRCDLCLRGN